MALSAQNLLNSAIALGYDALDDRGLKETLLYAAQTGGGGGGGSQQVFSGAGVPVGVLVGMDGTLTNLYVDTNTGILYTWPPNGPAWS